MKTLTNEPSKVGAPTPPRGGGGGLVKGGEEDGCERFGYGEVETCEINTEESIVEGDNGGEGSSYLRIAEITDECDGGEEGERGDGEGRT